MRPGLWDSHVEDLTCRSWSEWWEPGHGPSRVSLKSTWVFPGPETGELIPGNVASRRGGSEASNRCVVTLHLPRGFWRWAVLQRGAGRGPRLDRVTGVRSLDFPWFQTLLREHETLLKFLTCPAVSLEINFFPLLASSFSSYPFRLWFGRRWKAGNNLKSSVFFSNFTYPIIAMQDILDVMGPQRGEWPPLLGQWDEASYRWQGFLQVSGLLTGKAYGRRSLQGGEQCHTVQIYFRRVQFVNSVYDCSLGHTLKPTPKILCTGLLWEVRVPFHLVFQCRSLPPLQYRQLFWLTVI